MTEASFIENQEELKEQVLAHYGTPRHSGRYPWGSGGTPYQRASSFLGDTAALRKQGLSEKDIAATYGWTTTELRARQADASGYKKQEDIATVRGLREDKQMSIAAISERTGIPSTTVRAYLKPGADAKQSNLEQTRDALKANVDQMKYIDYGKGTEQLMGATRLHVDQAAQMLKDEGYESYEVHIPQIGRDDYTTTKVLVPPGTTKAELMQHIGDIRVPGVTVNAEGLINGGLSKPVSVNPKRVSIRYGDKGGTEMDGVMELRRGVADLDLGDAHYAQVRIAVNNSHYLKGMAIYADDLPDGVDIRFNTNKKSGTPMLGDKDHSVLKPLKDNGTDNNPFGAVIRQKLYKGKDGKSKLSALNIVNEEGDWDKWSASLSSQMLSKQRVSEAQKQLKKTRDKAQADYDEIMSITNPVVRRKLLEAHAEGLDSKSVRLKAASYPRQAAQVILPLKKIKPTEIYAPNFRHGESVALIRYPHGGTFEIPILTVNNKSQEGIRIMGKKATDAVGIHPSVAERLSGADFDGDNVVVIPNNSGRVRSTSALKGLEGFDPKRQYPYHDGMKVMSKKYTQRQMGEITNLINDMTIKGAPPEHITRAVKHSMVVIDANKHRLDYTQSAVDNDIKGLKRLYQDGERGGASTLISRSKSQTNVPDRRLRKASEGGKIDPKTGKLVYVETGASYKKTTPSGATKTIFRTTRTTKMDATDDARTLISKAARPIEVAYAHHANELKSMANRARKSSLEVKDMPYSPTARKTYAPEVASLKSKLANAYKNKPLERQAQLIANASVDATLRSHPDLDKEEVKKLKTTSLSNARARLGASKYKMNIEDREWEAIQAGAVRKNMLQEIVSVSDADHIKALALPHTTRGLSAAQQSRAKALLANHTTAEVADALGVSTSTIRSLMSGE